MPWVQAQSLAERADLLLAVSSRPPEHPDRKSYSTMDQPQMAMSHHDPSAMRSAPHLPPFRQDAYAGMLSPEQHHQHHSAHSMSYHPATHHSLPTGMPRKRGASDSDHATGLPHHLSTHGMYMEPRYSTSSHMDPSGQPGPAMKKKTRTNTPWTPAEEQRLRQMRDSGNSWGEIAKTFPTRTEGSVKKHWYKDMHYAEFAEDEVSHAFSAALLAAIKDYDANKWKVIGTKLGKPAKACEQYAKEHFNSGRN